MVRNFNYSGINIMLKIFLSKEFEKLKNKNVGISYTSLAEMINEKNNNPIFYKVLKYLILENIIEYADNFGKFKTIRLKDKNKLITIILNQDKLKLYYKFIENTHTLMML